MRPAEQLAGDVVPALLGVEAVPERQKLFGGTRGEVDAELVHHRRRVRNREPDARPNRLLRQAAGLAKTGREAMRTELAAAGRVKHRARACAFERAVLRVDVAEYVQVPVSRPGPD